MMNHKRKVIEFRIIHLKGKYFYILLFLNSKTKINFKYYITKWLVVSKFQVLKPSPRYLHPSAWMSLLLYLKIKILLYLFIDKKENHPEKII